MSSTPSFYLFICCYLAWRPQPLRSPLLLTGKKIDKGDGGSDLQTLRQGTKGSTGWGARKGDSIVYVVVREGRSDRARLALPVSNERNNQFGNKNLEEMKETMIRSNKRVRCNYVHT